MLYCRSRFSTDFDPGTTVAKFIAACSSGFCAFICPGGFSTFRCTGWGAVAVSAGFYLFTARQAGCGSFDGPDFWCSLVSHRRETGVAVHGRICGDGVGLGRNDSGAVSWRLVYRCIVFGFSGGFNFATSSSVGRSGYHRQRFFEKQIRLHFAQSMEAFEAAGDSETDIADMKAFVEKAVGGFASAYPAFVLIGSLISAMANYGLLRVVWGRIYGPGLFSERTFAEWICPENLVWGFIVSSAGLFLGQGMVADAGLNLFVIMLVIYFAQGMSIVTHFLKARKVPVFLWIALFILIFAQPLFIGLVAGIGVFDIWVDFRKIRNPLPEVEG